MDKDTEPHPSARLVSIGKPTFWLYWVICLTIYITNYIITSKSPGKFRTANPSVAILICVFLVLILNIIESAVSSPHLKKGFARFNNIFMVVSVILITLWIIIK